MDQTSLVGLYIHIPFCYTRCDFCAFYLEIYRRPPAEAFVTALSRECSLHASRETLAGRKIGSIYIGGGTPTTLSVAQLDGILSKIWQTFDVDPSAEITIEAHPDTVEKDFLVRLRELGFTRLSLGIQSLHHKELAESGRPASPHSARHVIELAREGGFPDINVDLMYGLPGQTLATWEVSLHKVIELFPTHLSTYALTVEEETALAQDIRKGVAHPPDEHLQAEMEALADETLRAAGYHHYEISNYARSGHQCRHNLLYWTGGQYLGLGPSAQSYVEGIRFGNVASLTQYQCLLDDARLPVEYREVLTEEQQRREATVFGLRLIGDHLPDQTVQATATGILDPLIAGDLVREGLLVLRGDHAYLTATGRRYADTVMAALI